VYRFKIFGLSWVSLAGKPQKAYKTSFLSTVFLAAYFVIKDVFQENMLAVYIMLSKSSGAP